MLACAVLGLGVFSYPKLMRLAYAWSTTQAQRVESDAQSGYLITHGDDFTSFADYIIFAESPELQRAIHDLPVGATLEWSFGTRRWSWLPVAEHRIHFTPAR